MMALRNTTATEASPASIASVNYSTFACAFVVLLADFGAARIAAQHD